MTTFKILIFVVPVTLKLAICSARNTRINCRSRATSPRHPQDIPATSPRQNDTFSTGNNDPREASVHTNRQMGIKRGPTNDLSSIQGIF